MERPENMKLTRKSFESRIKPVAYEQTLHNKIAMNKLLELRGLLDLNKLKNKNKIDAELIDLERYLNQINNFILVDLLQIKR